MGTITRTQKDLEDAYEKIEQANVKLARLKRVLKNQSQPRTVRDQMKRLMEMCMRENISGKNTKIDGYYVSFEFRPLENKCKTCGRER